MSVTSFKAADLRAGALFRAHPLPNWRSGVVVDTALFIFCLAMLALMLAWEGAETVPYHFLFLSVALVYGFRVWPLLSTIVVILLVTGSTGSIMYGHYRTGAIESVSELAEIVLMPALLVAMLWHARRAEAQRQTEAMYVDRGTPRHGSSCAAPQCLSGAVRGPAGVRSGVRCRRPRRGRA